jgi:Immunity protein 35
MQAEAIAAAYVRELARLDSPECVLLPAETREDAIGWVFFYQSREYVETGRPGAKLTGNGPLLVLRRTGEVRQLGAELPVEDYLVGYRARLPKPVDPRWLRLAMVPLAVAGIVWLVSGALGARFHTSPSGWLLIAVGLCSAWIGGLTYFDVGGVGAWTEESVRRGTPWRLDFPIAPFAGVVSTVIGAGFVVMGLGLLLGILR